MVAALLYGRHSGRDFGGTILGFAIGGVAGLSRVLARNFLFCSAGYRYLAGDGVLQCVAFVDNGKAMLPLLVRWQRSGGGPPERDRRAKQEFILDAHCQHGMKAPYSL